MGMLLTKEFSDAVRKRIKDTVNSAIAARSISARKVSIDVVGHDGLIRDIRAGRIPSADRLEALYSYLGLEFYYGPPRGDPAPVTKIADEEFDTVARFDALSAAGDGMVNFDEPPIDHLAFSRKWLSQNGINAGTSVLINVRGDSMEPSIYDGDLVMLDRRRTAIRSGRIYVFRDPDDGLRVKRLELIDGAAISLRSDNPKYPPEHRTGPEMNRISENIVGEVVWSGHTWI